MVTFTEKILDGKPCEKQKAKNLCFIFKPKFFQFDKNNISKKDPLSRMLSLVCSFFVYNTYLYALFIHYIYLLYTKIYMYIACPAHSFKVSFDFEMTLNIVKILTVISGVNRKDKLCYNLF